MWGCHEQPALTKQTNFQPEPLLTEGVSMLTFHFALLLDHASIPFPEICFMVNAGVWVHVTVVQI